jgi:hypothetical protein
MTAVIGKCKRFIYVASSFYKGQAETNLRLRYVYKTLLLLYVSFMWLVTTSLCVVKVYRFQVSLLIK